MDKHRMTKTIVVKASKWSSAQPQEIYALLRNSATYPAWSMIDSFESLQPGRDDLHGIGAIRFFRTGRFVMKEEITNLVPDALVSYVLRSGFPLLDYHSDTALIEQGGGTLIRWTSSFHPKHRMTGRFWQLVLYWTLTRMVRGLADAAGDPRRRARILALSCGPFSSKETFRQP
jgi:hypothetical protein